jgi:hypothetical protein
MNKVENNVVIQLLNAIKRTVGKAQKNGPTPEELRAREERAHEKRERRKKRDQINFLSGQWSRLLRLADASTTEEEWRSRFDEVVVLSKKICAALDIPEPGSVWGIKTIGGDIAVANRETGWPVVVRRPIFESDI